MSVIQRVINAAILWILAGILIGAYGVQVIYHEVPCPLCLLQRIGMFGVAFGAMLNLQFGIRPLHYAIILFSSLFGGFVALRQISLHVCPGFSEFGLPVLGLSLYTWSFIIFVCSIFVVALLLVLYENLPDETRLPSDHWFYKAASWTILILAFSNIFTTYALCGFGPCS